MLAVLPNVLKQPLYRLLFGYRIGRNVHLGITLLDAGECTIEGDVVIGHLNAVIGVKRLTIGDHVNIGHLNIIRGGDEVRLGRYAQVLRLNEINSIPDPETLGSSDPRFLLGKGAYISTGHKIDFTDRVDIGDRSMVTGRNSSIWTHNRQQTAPVSIGMGSWLGSESRMAPGSSIPDHSIAGMGAVVVGQLEGERHLFGGVPAKRGKELDGDTLALLERKTRNDLPDDL